MRAHVLAAIALFSAATITAASATKTQREVSFELSKAEVTAVMQDVRKVQRDGSLDVRDLSDTTYDTMADGFSYVGVDMDAAGDGGLECGAQIWPPVAWCCVDETACCQIDPNNGAMCYRAESSD